MAFPIQPPLMPMEARSVAELPQGSQWQFEPKWDGFRCLAFRDGEKIFLQSKSGQPLERYFPELAAVLKKLRAKRFVLDGEIIIPLRGRSSFDQLLLRVHPARSRVEKLAAEFPATLIVFDLLATEKGRVLTEVPLQQRRAQLQKFAARYFVASTQIQLSPAAATRAAGLRWLRSKSLGLDGVMAKRVDLPYLSGSRDGMQKIKHRMTADCVVGGFRYAEGKPVVGSLLLGLYDDAGQLNHVGYTSSFTAQERREITALVTPLKGGRGFTGKAPGGPGRWSTKRSSEWQALKPRLVVEVQYDSFTGERFRHGTTFLRFRPDKPPADCTYEQVKGVVGTKLSLLKARIRR